jgi:aminoglycoside phosphotransferase (APT) family kinase protein
MTADATLRADDVSLVRRLLADQFPHWAELPLTRVASSGTVNALYRLGEDLVVRLPRVPSGVGDGEIEREWLPRLAPLLPVAIPVALGAGTPTEDFPADWGVYRWLDGENPVEGELAEPRGLAEDLAGFVSAMRRIELPGGPDAYRGGSLRLQDAIAELGDRVDTTAVTAAWEDALSAPEWTGPPVWLHADLMPGNLLVDGGRLSAVIDFGTLGVGDPACDLIPAWNLLTADVRQVFRDRLQVDDATWARGRGKALSMALIQLPYYWDTNPVMAANARYVVREVLAGS